MPYYVLERGKGELYAMNMVLSEEEARSYGHEGEVVPVKAVFVWTKPESIETFRRFLSAIRDDPDTPFRGLIQDVQAGKVNGLELTAEQLQDRLRQYARVGVVAIDPGPEQKVKKIEEFLANLPG
ncbi:MAG: hypothetical protein CYG60_04160 [Actinobacteria bacterium]|nr:MAG: hypothetical protein CYG60_04160 [Actinomycetota bacterium]